MAPVAPFSGTFPEFSIRTAAQKHIFKLTENHLIETNFSHGTRENMTGNGEERMIILAHLCFLQGGKTRCGPSLCTAQVEGGRVPKALPVPHTHSLCQASGAGLSCRPRAPVCARPWVVSIDGMNELAPLRFQEVISQTSGPTHS